MLVALGLLLGACGDDSTPNVCGDDVASGGEACDGDDLDGQSCQSRGHASGALTCAADCQGFDTSACLGAECGNNAREAAELCDGNDLGGETCEGLGFDGGTLGGDADCLGFDVSSCTGAGCGDSTANGDEACDGDDLAGETCESLGFSGGTLSCAGDCGAFITSGCEADRFISHQQTDLSQIPQAAVDQAVANLHIVYQHTSHGSQLITGMDALMAFPPFGGTYAWDDSVANPDALDLDDYGIPADVQDLSVGDYLDGNGATPWVNGARALLDNTDNAHVNVVVWSWCSINGHDAQRYVDNMETLIAEYPAAPTPTLPRSPT